MFSRVASNCHGTIDSDSCLGGCTRSYIGSQVGDRLTLTPTRKVDGCHCARLYGTVTGVQAFGSDEMGQFSWSAVKVDRWVHVFVDAGADEGCSYKFDHIALIASESENTVDMNESLPADLRIQAV